MEKDKKNFVIPITIPFARSKVCLAWIVRLYVIPMTDKRNERRGQHGLVNTTS
jgi:hypothetical protein